MNPSAADCEQCELQEQCKRKLWCGPQIPEDFNGLMIVGEGPGPEEVASGTPFVGRSGKLLNALLDTLNIDRDRCYITNATLCKPPPKGAKSLMEAFPNAIYACMPRLEAEIAAARPRVILALGSAALAALTSYTETVKKRVPFDCEYCASSDRKVTGVMCSVGDCQHIWEEDNGQQKPEECPACGVSWKRLKVRRVRCPECRGLKTREQDFDIWHHDYKIGEVAGAVFDADKFGWDDFGVKYVVPTYHPAFVLRGNKSEGSGEKKHMAGQFAADAVVAHIRKAYALLDDDYDWGVEYQQTAENDDDDAADHVREYFTEMATQDLFATDIETEAWGSIYTCTECGKLSGYTESNDNGWKLEKRIEVRCQHCGVITSQVAHRGELDARILEEVSLITCIGFKPAEGHGLVVDTRNMGPKLHQALREVLEDPTIRHVFHHGTYDMPVIRKLWDIQVAGYTDDTLIQHHILCPDETHSLAHVAFRYTWARAWKPPKTLRGRPAHETFDELARYNAKDIQLTMEAHQQMDARLKAKKLDHIYDLDMKLQAQATEMRWNGMPFDYERGCEVGAEALKKADEALAAMRDILGNADFNPRSPDQLREALYDTLGYAVIAWTDGGKSGNRKPSTAADTLARLPDSPFKRAVLDYSDSNKILKSFFDVRSGEALPSRGLNLWDDGRIHFTWKPYGTVTGRWTSSPNAQNWEKWVRSMVQAPKGRRIVGADYDQLELRIIAGLCGDETLIDLCLNADDSDKLNPDCDPHSYVGRIAFGAAFTGLDKEDPNHDPKNPRCACEKCSRKALRELCKTVIYALNYGAGDSTVLTNIYKKGYRGPAITVETIGTIRQAVYTAFDAIPAWREQQLAQAEKNWALYSPLLHRHRLFPLGEVPSTECYNFPIQSCGADIVNQRSTIFYEQHMRRIDPTARYIAQMHDAVYYEVDEDRADEFCAALTDTLSWTTPLYKGGPEMPFTAKAEAAGDWSKAG